MTTDLAASGRNAGVLPEGWRLVLDRSVAYVAEGTALLGGRPGRLLSLTPAGQAALESLLVGRPTTPDLAARRLGRRLVDAGLAHPRPPASSPEGSAPSVTVVVPVRDRPAELDRCLASLGRSHPVLVVDDGSNEPEAVSNVCRRHGARLLRRGTNGGPAVARNDATDVLTTDVVAFVDSDCRVRPAAIGALLRYFADPAVGAVAPRVRPAGAERPPPAGRERRPRRPLIDRYSASRSALDMGAEEGPVGPGFAVRYVPAATLLVRRRALGTGFDPRLRVGEDVDFVWRLVDRGWQVRYVAGIVVEHREPDRWGAHLWRRLRYGTSAGPLARRHPDRMAPVELRLGPATVVAAVVAGRGGAAAVVGAAGTGLAVRRLAGSKVPATRVIGWQLAAPWWTLLGLARATATVVVPGLPALALARRGRRVRWVAVLLFLPGIVEWWQRRPDVDPVAWTLACLADDLAYGAGVWLGCMRAGTAAPLLPILRLPRPSAVGRHIGRNATGVPDRRRIAFSS